LVALVVLHGLGIDVILGMNWMSKNGLLIDAATWVVMLAQRSNWSEMFSSATSPEN
jgi:hypothetical protein